MSDIVIRAENLGKSYIIGHEKQERYTALRDVLVNQAKKVVSKTKQVFKGGQLIAGNELEEFWALKEINFEIKQGDRVGIIGRNGAGKSTLLKVLSRITEPTTGKITLKGRVASLLEVGTGFHPELTGRENIFLNGAILGMSRVEVRRKFDEIVDFSGVEKFLDTPVKRYSSGMYVRLAFAVAAYMEPEILIVDEVLAVGDAEFQKKCLGKMEDVSKKEGRTVLFVSHNMVVIDTLCNKSILLKNGTIQDYSTSKNVISKYLNESNSQKDYNNFNLVDYRLRKGTGEAIFEQVKFVNYDVKPSDDVIVEFIINSNKDLKYVDIAISFSTTMGQPLLQYFSKDVDQNITLKKGLNKVNLTIQNWLLNEGTYLCGFWLGQNQITIDWTERSFYVKVNKGKIKKDLKSYITIDSFPIVHYGSWELKDN